jgi:hydroxymethylpyrimidine/phosphomethylpyrimidine kinase
MLSPTMATKSHQGLPCVLAIGGLDPGGGAGLLADARALHAAGVFGCGVAAVLTVQSTDGLTQSQPVAPRLVLQQAREILRVQRVLAVKVGALGSAANARAVGRLLRGSPLPIVLDPVMSPTRGRPRLLAEGATVVVRRELIPRVTLVTANADEAAALTGKRVSSVADATRAAAALVELGAEAALVKGGHLLPGPDAVDVLARRGEPVALLRGPRLLLPPIHGGGCVLASLIAGYLARATWEGRPRDVLASVRRARRAHQRALGGAVDVGGAMRVLCP